MGFPKVGQVIKGLTIEYYEYPTEIIVKGDGGAIQVKRAFKEFYDDRRTLSPGMGTLTSVGMGKSM